MTLADKIARAKTDYNNVYNKGVEDGLKSEYDRFWDTFQDYGRKVVYTAAFSDTYNDEIFKPKYDIIPTNAYMIFNETRITDLVKILDDCGVVLDLSKATNTQYMFMKSNVTRVGVIDASSSTNSKVFSSTFSNAKSVVSVECLRWSENARGLFEYTFNSCSSLESVIFDGIIFDNGLNLQWSTKLNKESITSIINCLSTTTSGLSITLSYIAVNKAFETSAGANDGSTSTEWTTLIATKSNWTINLIVSPIS